MRKCCANTHAAQEKENEGYGGLQKSYQSVELLLMPLIHDADTRLSISGANKVNYNLSSIIHIRYYKGGILFH